MKGKNLFKGMLFLFLFFCTSIMGQKITIASAAASSGNAALAIDGNGGSRWESEQGVDPQWIAVDLGAELNIGKVVLSWETANAKDYTLEGSANNADWTVIATKTNMAAGPRTDEITEINTTYRYLRVYGTVRNTPWGYSIYEFEVYQASVPVLTSIVVSPANFFVIPGATKQFTAQGKDQNNDNFDMSGTTTEWSVSGAGCSIDENGLVTTTVDGEYTITATNSGVSGNASLSVYTPQLTTLTITPQNASIDAGNSQQFTVTGKDQKGVAMTITSQSWKVLGAGCSIDNTGLLTTNANASGYFYATVTANSDNGTLEKDIYFSVGNLAKGITASASSGTAAAGVDGNAGTRWESEHGVDPQWFIIDLGSSKNIGAIRIKWDAANAKDYTLSFSNTNNGTDWDDTITKAGMAGGDRTDLIGGLNLNYRYIKLEGTTRNGTWGYSFWEFEVYGVTAPFLSSIVVNPSSVSLTAGESQQFTAEGRDQNGNPFDLSGDTIWTVNGTGCSIIKGLLTTTKAGIYTIKAENNSFTATANADVLPSDPNVAIGKNANATTGIATAACDDNIGTRWESASSDPQSITVDLGVIQAITNMRIKWEAASAKNYVVEGSNDSINWTNIATKTDMAAGERTDAIYDLIGCNYRYVRLTGTARTSVYGYSIWEFMIYAKAKVIPVITWNNPVDITYGDTLSATQLNATSDVDGTIIYTPAVGTKLTAGDVQELTLTFTPTDALVYGNATKTVLINVKKATSEITWNNPSDITFGDTLSVTQLNATAGIDGIFTYTPTIGAKLNAGNSQELSVSFAPTDDTNFAVVTKKAYINVKKANPEVSWSNPIDITYGTILSATQLNATANLDGQFTYTPASGATLNAGINQELNVEFTPTDAANYNTVSKKVNINVLKASPVITWNNPADITFGALLSATQLNASADIDGVFTYNPTTGTKLNSGNVQELSVEFTPTDATNYSVATLNAYINVKKAAPVVSWNTPDDIDAGTALSVTQLNASANIPGTMVYNPDLYTVMNVGDNQALNVVFTPTDTNYIEGTKTVYINVLDTTKGKPVITWVTPSDITYGTLLSASQLNATADIDGTFTYNPPIGTKLDAGNDQIISVSFKPLDAANYNSIGKSVKINVLKANPVITWATPSDITYGTLLSASQLNASTDVAGTLVYNPALNAKLTSGNKQLKVDFTPNDANNYNAVSKTININVQKVTPVITWNNPADIEYGTLLGNNQLNALADQTGTYDYSPASGTKLNVGTQNITVNFTPADTNYASASKTVSINVLKATPVITWNTPAGIVYGTLLGNDQLNASSDIDGTFEYTQASGTKMNAGENQSLTVQFTPTDASKYNSVQKSVTISVSKATPVLTWNTPASIVYETMLDESQLNATTEIEGTFEYSPAKGTKLDAGDDKVLSVTFTPNDAANYNNATALVNIDVAKATPIITWEEPATIPYGTLLSSNQLNATSNITGVFTYNKTVGTKLNAGSYQLIAAFEPDNDNYNAVKDTVILIVNKVTSEITWNNPADIVYGTQLGSNQLNASSTVDGLFTYDPASGTLLNAGENQTLNVSFVPADTNYLSATKSVKINVSKATPELDFDIPTEISYGIILTEEMLAVAANVGGTFSYTPALGEKLKVGAHTFTISFTPNNANFNFISKEVEIKIVKANPVIAWENPADITYGTLLSNTQLNASSVIEGNFAYSPALDTKLASGIKNLKVDFTPADTNYNAVSKTVSLKVIKADAFIDWNNPADIIYGTLLSATQLNATADAEGSLNYTPAAGFKLNAGEARELRVDFTPADTNINASHRIVNINVKKATPVITWNNPADITYETLLSNTQLNATADVSGTLEYTPAVGTKLNIGDDQSLNVTFTPTDAQNYNTVSKTVIINVKKGTNVATSESTIEIYPNPFAEKLTIKNVDSNTKVSMYDMLGNLILTTSTVGNEVEIVCGNMKPGSYIIVLKTNNSVYRTTIVKK